MNPDSYRSLKPAIYECTPTYGTPVSGPIPTFTAFEKRRSGGQCPAPLLAELRRRIVNDKTAMAESGSERKTGKLSLVRTTFIKTLEADLITEAHSVRD
jgi:hypothetical protein